MNVWKELPDRLRTTFDTYSDDWRELQHFLELIGDDTDVYSPDGPLCNFNTSTIVGKYVHWDLVDDDQCWPTIYAIGIIFDGDGGARVYVTSRFGTLRTHSVGRYLFDEVRTCDIREVGYLLEDMADILEG